MLRKVLFSPEIEQQIIEFYLAPNMICDVVDKFKDLGLTNKLFYRIAKDHNIKLHSKKVINELRKKTYLAHFGVDHPMKNKTVVDRVEKTTLAKYGVKNISCLEETTIKKEKTFLEKYGVTNPNKLESIKEKKKQTCLNKYGVSSPFESAEARIKAKETYLTKYKVANPMQAKVIQEKAKQTTIAKYGVTSFTKTQEYRDKTRETNLLRYGKESYSQTNDFHKKCKKHFVYKDQTFDSFPELAFYLYNIENNNIIERCPVSIEYWVLEKKHYYIPDFKVNGILYEIKGDHFKSKDLGWKNPFDISEEAQLVAAEKYKIAIKNNVTILYSSDYKKYIDWFFKNNLKLKDFIV